MHPFNPRIFCEIQIPEKSLQFPTKFRRIQQNFNDIDYSLLKRDFCEGLVLKKEICLILENYRSP